MGGPEVYPYSDRCRWPHRGGPHIQPCVYPNWDNTPRSGRGGLVLTGATPEKFARNVEAAVATLADRPPQERLLWVKSWNEWAEGNHLEPDLARWPGLARGAARRARLMADDRCGSP